jgi:hypothetical protein
MIMVTWSGCKPTREGIGMWKHNLPRSTPNEGHDLKALTRKRLSSSNGHHTSNRGKVEKLHDRYVLNEAVAKTQMYD